MKSAYIVDDSLSTQLVTEEWNFYILLFNGFWGTSMILVHLRVSQLPFSFFKLPDFDLWIYMCI